MSRDDAYLLDMLLAARQALAHIGKLTRDQFFQSRLHQDAVVRQLSILGEAAAKITGETRAAYPEIQWSEIIGMRQRLVHDYRNIKLDLVWTVLEAHLPPLIATLERIVPPEEPVS